jgi:hypothetical protein
MRCGSDENGLSVEWYWSCFRAFVGDAGGQCDIGAVELKPCPYSESLLLNNETLSGENTYEACESIEAGNNLVLDYSANVILRSGNEVALRTGFSVESGAQLRISIDWAFWENLP